MARADITRQRIPYSRFDSAERSTLRGRNREAIRVQSSPLVLEPQQPQRPLVSQRPAEHMQQPKHVRSSLASFKHKPLVKSTPKVFTNSSRPAHRSLVKTFHERSRVLFNSVKVLSNKLGGMKAPIAALLLLFGIYVTLDGYIANQQLKEKIAGLGESSEVLSEVQTNSNVSDDGGAQASPASSTVISESRPNDLDLAQHKVADFEPRLINIDTINVKARVQNTGYDSDGAIDVPKNIYDTSWFNESSDFSTPGGAALILGHVTGVSSAGIFFNLHKLVKGDTVKIAMGNGKIRSFKVVEKKVYPYDDVDMNKALASADSSKFGVNLMTCGGKFIASTGTYDERLLVRTVEI